jgi:hypothetical protein
MPRILALITLAIVAGLALTWGFIQVDRHGFEQGRYAVVLDLRQAAFQSIRQDHVHNVDAITWTAMTRHLNDQALRDDFTRYNTRMLAEAARDEAASASPATAPAPVTAPAAK